ncbi:MAG: hypothetical protein JNK15_11710 [Planctomycetes bacterium]|nr:hypothetical protein [Planctomycetota bacterium]
MSSLRFVYVTGFTGGAVLTACVVVLWQLFATASPSVASTDLGPRHFAERPLDAWLVQLVRGTDAERRIAARNMFLIRWGLDGPWSARAHATAPTLPSGTAARVLHIVPFLLVALDDPLPDVQIAALTTLEAFGRQAAWASDAVLRFATRTPSPELKRRAAMVAWRASGEPRRPLRMLHELLADQDEAVRLAAARDVVQVCSGLDASVRLPGPLGIDLLARLDPLLATDDADLRLGVHSVLAQLLR